MLARAGTWSVGCAKATQGAARSTSTANRTALIARGPAEVESRIIERCSRSGRLDGARLKGVYHDADTGKWIIACHA
jgi:hypothetical protein